MFLIFLDFSHTDRIFSNFSMNIFDYFDFWEYLQVLENCNLVERVAKAHHADSCAVGYLGHLRELANELLKVTKHSSQVATLLGGKLHRNFHFHFHSHSHSVHKTPNFCLQRMIPGLNS
jgi:hypothetical protein